MRGKTAAKTAKAIEKPKGGVLFIDEAYAMNGNSQNDFSQVAIDTLLKAMDDNRKDLVVIVAGYDKLMATSSTPIPVWNRVSTGISISTIIPWTRWWIFSECI